jgi:phosphodiesterase/alkaline phosphatase D-like protein
MGRKAFRKRWVPLTVAKRATAWFRRSFKRQMTGESNRQWIERNLQDSQAGVAVDLIQCFLG